MIPSASQVINMGADVSEISSSTSREGNKEAFIRKIQSRKYKCLAHVAISTLAVLLIIWVAILAKGLQYIVTKLDVDVHEMLKTRLFSHLFFLLVLRVIEETLASARV